MSLSSLFRILSLTSSLLISPVVNAFCIDNWACYEVVKQTNSIEFWLSNKKPFPITATLDVWGRNTQRPAGKPNHYSETRVLTSRQRTLALTLTASDPTKPIRYNDQFYWTPGILNAKHDDTYRYALPYAQGAHYRLVQGFGGGYSHKGASRYAVDFAMPVGTPVHAARGGQVIDLQQKYDRGGPSRRYSRYANFVTILHADGTTGEYYHLRQYGVQVALGDNVNPGQLLGYSGNTGFSSLPHLHFAVYQAKSHGKYASVPFKFSQSLQQPER